jgi:hypothetical protein
MEQDVADQRSGLAQTQAVVFIVLRVELRRESPGHVA